MTEINFSDNQSEALERDHPLYSICVSNYNMADYLEEALSSVLQQVGEEFEVVVVDDGSSDSSVRVLQQMAQRFKQLRIFPYPRDPKRYLGETRNLSVQHARGKYLLLHIDADDIWEPGISDWCEKARQLCERFDDEVYIAGKQINMVSKRLFTQFGGYRNIYYTEDRDLWSRLAAVKKLVFVEHDVFRARMALPAKVRFRKTIKTMWHTLLNDMRTGRSILPSLIPTLLETVRGRKLRGWVGTSYRLGFFPFAAMVALIKGPVENYSPSLSADDWRRYRKINTRTFDEWRKELFIR